jgi:small subunit ribosomal protein S1
MELEKHQRPAETPTDKSTDSTQTPFAHQLETYSAERPKRGQILHGEILRIDQDAVLMDVGAKCDAIVPRNELEKLDSDHLDSLSVGDKCPVYVLRTPLFGGRLLVSIERGMAHKDWERAKELLSSSDVVELEVTGTNRGGITVAFGKLRGFVPNSHLPRLRNVSKSERDEIKRGVIGSRMCLHVIEIEPKKRKLILSARRAQEEQREKRIRELNINEVVTGTVVSIVDFGAFIDLGGVDGLLHISEYDHRNEVSHLGDVLEVGQEVKTEIKEIDTERGRIGLSRKALLPSPWSAVQRHYLIGDLVEGEITNLVEFGAFVRLPEGVEGLIHKTELGIVAFEGVEDIVEPGQKVLTRILSIDPDRERISLSLSQVSYEEKMQWLNQKQLKPEGVEEK